MGEVSDRGLRRLGAVRLATVTATPASESEAGDLWRFALCSGVESPSALAELFGADRAQLVRRVCGSTWRSEVLVKSKLRAANQFLWFSWKPIDFVGSWEIVGWIFLTNKFWKKIEKIKWLYF
jgi:hypothetical protein